MNHSHISGRVSVQVIVAIIGLVGVLAAAVLANLEFFFGDGDLDPPRRMGPLEAGVNRHGSDFSPNPERAESPEACSRLCDSTAECKAMTFVRSPQGLPGGACWLKFAVPVPTPKEDMTSAVKSPG